MQESKPDSHFYLTVENRDSHRVSQSEIAGDKRIYQHL